MGRLTCHPWRLLLAPALALLCCLLAPARPGMAQDSKPAASPAAGPATDPTVPVLVHPATQVFPAVDGRTVVWQDERSGPADIFLADLDTGGVAILHHMCGPGVVSDLVLTGRIMDADEAYQHGIVSRIVPPEGLDEVCLEMAHQIAKAPLLSVRLARDVIRHLTVPEVKSSMADEAVYQTMINRSDDFAEFRTAHAEGRDPRYQGS